MIPILYDKQHIGADNYFVIGKLPAWIECEVTEERNGEFYLKGKLPYQAQNVDELAVDRIIECAPAPPRSNYGPTQPFRIRKLTKPPDANYVEVEAHHVSYQLTENIVQPASVNKASAQEAMLWVFGRTEQGNRVIPPLHSAFAFQSDIVLTEAVQYTQLDPITVRAALGGVDGSFLDLYGGEFEWDGWAVRLLQSRGVALDIPIAYGKNMATLEFDTDAAGMINGYYGWGRWNGTYKDSGPIYQPGYTDWAYPRIEAVDFSNEFDELPSDAALAAALQAYADKQNDYHLPTSITVTAVPDVLQSVHLCDIVRVIHPGYKISQPAKVVKTVYDPIRERYNAVTIGEIQTGITDTIARVLSEVF